MKTGKILIAVLVLAVIFLVSACTITGQVVRQDSVKIGYLAPLTGIGAYWGEPNVKGAEIAKEEGNLHNYYGSPAFWLIVIAIVTICIVLEFADY